jgi:hypothetical protein
VAVVGPHVVGAQVDRAVYRLADAAADVIGDEQERSPVVVESAGAGEAGDPATDDDRFVARGQRWSHFPLTTFDP